MDQARKKNSDTFNTMHKFNSMFLILKACFKTRNDCMISDRYKSMIL